jgi:hypothetical protein
MNFRRLPGRVLKICPKANVTSVRTRLPCGNAEKEKSRAADRRLCAELLFPEWSIATEAGVNMVYVVQNDDLYCRMKRQWSAAAKVLKRKKGADALI